MNKDEYVQIHSPLKKAVHNSSIHQCVTNPFSKYQSIHPLTVISIMRETEEGFKTARNTTRANNEDEESENDMSFITQFVHQEKEIAFFKVPSVMPIDYPICRESSSMAFFQIKPTEASKSKSTYKLSSTLPSENFTIKMLHKLSCEAKCALAKISNIPLVSQKIIDSLKLSLNMSYSKKMVAVIDLDETLVFTSITEMEDSIKIYFNKSKAFVKIRPFAVNLLKDISLYYEVIIFTASLKEYADAIINRLDVGKAISKAIYRESCVVSNKIIVKDLRILSRDLRNAVLIDNSITCMAAQPDNGIPVTSYRGQNKDDELLKIKEFLISNASCSDLRALVRETFRVKQLSDYCRVLY